MSSPYNTPDGNGSFERTALDAPQADGTVMECGICWTVYDPAVGDPVWQIPPGTPFAQLPDHWSCPHCDAPRHKFLEQTGD